MSLKNLMVTFVTSEEASITQRSALSIGSVLTVVMLVAMALTMMTPVPAKADECCALPVGCYVQPCGDWQEELCNPNCMKVYRSCQYGCIEYYYQCAGGNRCDATCVY